MATATAEISVEVHEIARRIADGEKADIYLYNGPINEDGYGRLIQTCDHQQDSAILLLTTNGGSANAAYRIGRWLQAMYDDGYGALVFDYCKSAGTLVVTGANRLIMAPGVGELGPLDVQLRKRDEIWEQRSGLVLRAALNSLADAAEELFERIMMSVKVKSVGSVRFKLASDLAVEMTKGLLSPIYAQMSPESLGEDYQELMVALEYAKRLAKLGKNISEKSVKQLVHGYPSHDFVIDALEAGDLFVRVDRPTEDMFALASKMQSLVFGPHPSTPTVLHLSRPVKKAEQDTDEAKEESAPNAAAQGESAPRAEGTGATTKSSAP